MDVSGAPSSSPTRSGNCLDSPEVWHDTDGEMYNCDWYGVGDRCTTWGESSNFNTTANEACCSCGGGRILDTSLSFSLTPSPSNSPSHQVSLNPSKTPSYVPSIKPSFGPTSRPPAKPSTKPSPASSLSPTRIASSSPTLNHSSNPSNSTSFEPTDYNNLASDSTSCVNSPQGWHDADGPNYGCDWYSHSNRCEQYGNNYANFGKTANQACCSCGGGISLSGNVAVPTSSPSIPLSNRQFNVGSFCNDKMEGWFDVDGGAYTCEWYSHSGRCQQYGHGSANFGLTANECCCSCGGGNISSSNHEESPATPPSSGSTETTCNDKYDGWYDADGEAYDCQCCGGGNIVNNANNQGSPSPPSLSQGSSPSSSSGSGSTLGSVCHDKMEGWFDVDGGAYTCEWYSHNGRCQQYGNGSANFGFTANECCCSCGGGNIVNNVNNQGSPSPPSLSQGSSPSSSSGSGSTLGSVCHDKMEGWFDVDGGAYTCEWYSHNGRCQQYGNGSANFGFTANECCCSCGGGTKSS